MNYKSMGAIAAGGLFLAGMFVFFPRGEVRINDPLGMTESSSLGKGESGKSAEPVIVEYNELSAQELREFAKLFEPLERNRKFAKIFSSGQSMLCDIYDGPDGSLGLTFLTVSSLSVEGGSPVIKVQQNTMLLQKNGDTNEVAAPSITFRDYQSAEISMEGPDDAHYTLKVEGSHMGENKIQVMVEFLGIPIVD